MALTNFQFGPMEWLWRTLTYGRASRWQLLQGKVSEGRRSR